jgi:hypothetical protein
MPFPVKFGLSLAVAIAALLSWFYLHVIGAVGPQWALAFLGPFMVGSLWVFPEVMRKPADNKVSKRKVAGVQ